MSNCFQKFSTPLPPFCWQKEIHRPALWISKSKIWNPLLVTRQLLTKSRDFRRNSLCDFHIWISELLTKSGDFRQKYLCDLPSLDVRGECSRSGSCWFSWPLSSSCRPPAVWWISWRISCTREKISRVIRWHQGMLLRLSDNWNNSL